MNGAHFDTKVWGCPRALLASAFIRPEADFTSFYGKVRNNIVVS